MDNEINNEVTIVSLDKTIYHTQFMKYGTGFRNALMKKKFFLVLWKIS